MAVEISAPNQIAPGRWQVTATLPFAGDYVQIAVTAPEALAARALAGAQAMLARRAERSYGSVVSGNGEASPVVRMWRRVEDSEAFQSSDFIACVHRLRAELPHLLPILTKVPVTLEALKHAAKKPASSAEQTALRHAIGEAKARGAANYSALKNTGVIVATMKVMADRHGPATGYGLTADLKKALACVQRANAGGKAARCYIARCFERAQAGDQAALRRCCFLVAVLPVAMQHPIAAPMAPAAPVLYGVDELELEAELDELMLEAELDAALDADAMIVGASARIRANSDQNLLRVLRALSRRGAGYRPRRAA